MRSKPVFKVQDDSSCLPFPLAPRCSSISTGGCVGKWALVHRSVLLPSLSYQHHQVIAEHVSENVPAHRGKGSQVHSFTCLLQSFTEIHHLGRNTFWHAPLPKFTPSPYPLHWYLLSLQLQTQDMFILLLFGFNSSSCRSAVASVCFLRFSEEIPVLWIHWQDLSSSQFVVAGKERTCVSELWTPPTAPAVSRPVQASLLSVPLIFQFTHYSASHWMKQKSVFQYFL